MNCIFCEIANGIIRTSPIYEDDILIVINDINPITEGHCLIIPKKHSETILDTDEEILCKMILISKKIGFYFEDKYGTNNFNILNANGKNAQQSIPHLHFHMVPRRKNDNIDLWLKET